jgi:hypothetical protein
MPRIKRFRLLIWFLPYLFVLVGFPVSVWAMSVSLAWDPSPSPDVSGYRLYYKSGHSGAPYDGTDAYEGPSPIDVGNSTNCAVSSLDGQRTYYFVVTAYNADAESGFSNEVSTADGSSPAQGASSSGGGGGGGGGCFISAAADGNFKGFLAFLILPVSLFVLSLRRVWGRFHR